MGFGGPTFVLVLVAICTGAWIINNWIRARHGYSISDDWGRNITPLDTAETKRLADENAVLKQQLVRLEDRLQTLERIATDEPNRLSAEIDRLR